MEESYRMRGGDLENLLVRHVVKMNVSELGNIGVCHLFTIVEIAHDIQIELLSWSGGTRIMGQVQREDPREWKTVCSLKKTVDIVQHVTDRCEG